MPGIVNTNGSELDLASDAIDDGTLKINTYNLVLIYCLISQHP